jgi:outer membrane protein OmpA-like peptidoglycan-associated protein
MATKIYTLLITTFVCLYLGGQEVRTTEFFFNSNDTLLTEYSQRKLDAFISSVKSTPLYIMKLRVFSDTVGPAAYNKELSNRRANAILRQLGDLGKNSYIEIGIYGKEYDSLKYPLENLQMWRRLEMFYQHEPPVIAEEVYSSQDSVKVNRDTMYFETFVSDFEDDYKKPQKIYIFDTLSDQSILSIIQLEIQFVQNTDTPFGSSYKEIISLGEFMKRYPDLSIVIRGHVCCGKNKKMSKKRAKKVYKTLAEYGISKKRMKFKGMSNKEPLVYPEVTEKDRQMNRRVDVMFSK